MNDTAEKLKIVTTVKDNTLFQTKEIEVANSSIGHLLICNDDWISAGSECFTSIVNNEFEKKFQLCAEFSSSNWHSMKNDLALFLAEHFKGKEGFAAEIKVLAEELLLNAFFNAPIDEKGNKLYVNRKRSENVILENKTTELSILSYNKSVIVNVADYFGTLYAADIFNQIIAAKNRNISELPNDRHGAGMGLGLVYKYADILIFKISEGICTHISLIKFRKKVGYKLICTFNV